MVPGQGSFEYAIVEDFVLLGAQGYAQRISYDWVNGWRRGIVWRWVCLRRHSSNFDVHSLYERTI